MHTLSYNMACSSNLLREKRYNPTYHIEVVMFFVCSITAELDQGLKDQKCHRMVQI